MTSLRLYATPTERLEIYLRTLRSQRGQTLIITPEILDTLWLADVLRVSKQRLTILTSQQSKAAAWQSYTAFATGKAEVLIGTRFAAAVPASKLAHLFIDRDEDASHYQSDMHPHYDARTILELRAKGERVPLTILSETPRVERYPLLNPELTNGGKVGVIVSLRDHWRSGQAGFLTTTLTDAIARALDAKKQTILFLNRKGYANLYECRDCRELTAAQSVLFCPRCHCPDLKERRPGIARLVAEVSKLFPDARVSLLERAREGQKPLPYPGSDIIICTEVYLHWYRTRAYDEQVGCVGIVFPDPLWHKPDFRANELALTLLRGFQNIAAAKQADCIVQTADPDSRVIRALAGELQTFYTDELADRRALGYPPYGNSSHY